MDISENTYTPYGKLIYLAAHMGSGCMKMFGHLRNLKRLREDESGAVLVWVSVMIFVIFAFVGLAIDGARLYNLNSNLQEIADAAALAGARELNGAEDAIDRARAAAYALQNDPEWTDNSEGVEIVATVPNWPRFFKVVNGNLVETTDPSEATHIKVTTASRSISPTYTSVLSAGSDIATRAEAVAKVAYSVCKPVQSFLCNPWEGQGGPVGAAANWSSRVSRGDMFLLAGGSGLAPGNWGLIEADTKGKKPEGLAALWAADTPSSCPTENLINGPAVRTGDVSKFAIDGMNVRFDRPYGGFAAAPVTIDGWRSASKCSDVPVLAVPPSTSGGGAQTGGGKGGGGQGSGGSGSTDQPIQTDNATAYFNQCRNHLASCPLPRDRDLQLIDPTWSQRSQLGSGPSDTDLESYWKNHHTAAMPTSTELGLGSNERIIRYDLYRTEVKALKDKLSGYFNTPVHKGTLNLEPPAPQCTTNSGNEERRLINVAIVDCDYWSIKGSSNNLPIATRTAQFFMTEPARDDWNGEKTSSRRGRIYAELVQTYEVNQEGGSVFQIVQLVK